MREAGWLSWAVRLVVSLVTWIGLYLIGYWMLAYLTQGVAFPPPEPGGLVLLLVFFVVARVYSRRRQHRA